MRPRYYKQRDQIRCGQIAIFNALKWAGGFVLTAKQALPCLDVLCEYIKPEGIPHRPLDRALRFAGRGYFDVRRVYTPKLKEIEKHLRAGGAIIINFRWKGLVAGEMKDSRHYVLVTDTSPGGKYFGVVNYQTDDPVYHRIHRNAFKSDLLRFRQPPFKGWFLTRTSGEKSPPKK
ncbi:hypothetical protein LCGC14_0817360 [marine sediment metagenome]|uniref:Peptidase C39-like domain-containing protein n=1 Tax=marine sediment metagenome TaxID=412755 RepID=A0A0F9S4S4_9ZZZZ